MISVIVLWDKRLLENPQICSWNKKGPLFTLSKLTEIWCRWSIFAIHREQGFRWPTLDQSSAGINKISIFYSRTQPDIIRVVFECFEFFVCWWQSGDSFLFPTGVGWTLCCCRKFLNKILTFLRHRNPNFKRVCSRQKCRNIGRKLLSGKRRWRQSSGATKWPFKLVQKFLSRIQPVAAVVATI